MDKKRELIKEWIEKAEHDLGMAELAIKHKPEFADSICFHCQQGAEKYLKAALIYLDLNFRKSHSLVYLLDLITDKLEVFDEIYFAAEILEDYGVEVRLSRK